MQTWRDSVQNVHRTVRNIHRAAASRSANATAMQAMKAMQAIHSSGAAQERGRVARRGASTRGKTLSDGEQQPQHENGRTSPKCTAHLALARAVAECYLIEEAQFGQGL